MKILTRSLGLLLVALLPQLTGGAADVAAQLSTSAGAYAPGEAPRVAETIPDVARHFDFELSIRNIMRGPEHVGEGPTSVSWTDDSRWLYFRWLPAGSDWDASRELYRVPAGGGEPERVEEAAADSVALFIAGGDLSPDRRLRVTARDGDIHLVNRQAMTSRRLTHTVASAGSPTFSADGRRVYFTQDDNVFAISLAEGGIRQLTDIRSGSEPKDPPEAEGHKAYLEEQQRELFEHIRRRRALEEERDAARERARERNADERLETLWIERPERVSSLSIEPNGRYVAITVSRPADATGTMVPNWVTASGYTEPIDTRSKVGDEQSRSRVGVIDVASGELTWLDPHGVDAAAETPPDSTGAEGSGRSGAAGAAGRPEGSGRAGAVGAAGRPEGSGRAGAAGARNGNDREAAPAVSFRGWNDAGTHGLLFSTARDHKTRWIYAFDAATGEVTTLDTHVDSAWVAGPCFGCVGWIPESDRAYFTSEDTGFAHLYAVDADGGNRRQLTSGDWEVHAVDVPEDRSHFLLRTNEGTPFEQHVHRMNFDGAARVRLTDGVGTFSATPSPDGRRLAIVHSRANRPPELFLARNGTGVEMEQVTVSPSAEWLTFPWTEPEIIHFAAEDGTQVPARIYRPSDWGVEANGAAVIFVHGAGYLQNVHNWWSSYYREYMFHHFLTAQGYTVLDIDYRGSAGYGRDWRTGIYRWMGGKDLSDQVDGARYLAANEGVDPARVGIYGGSYGGFITLMALFTEADRFHAGAALRSVGDWAHYNHNYTSRILNQPQDDDEAYRMSSPIYHAEGLKGHLLMLHGMVDTNVHFSDVVRVAQRLIELGKENWEMAIYPVENHGFAEPNSWTDEYRRIFELFERTLLESPRVN